MSLTFIYDGRTGIYSGMNGNKIECNGWNEFKDFRREHNEERIQVIYTNVAADEMRELIDKKQSLDDEVSKAQVI